MARLALCAPDWKFTEQCGIGSVAADELHQRM
jgi:hypothetical protein